MPAKIDTGCPVTTWSEGNRFYFGYQGHTIFSYEVLENVPVFVFRRYRTGGIVDMIFFAIRSYTRMIGYGLVDLDDIELQLRKMQMPPDRCRPLTLHVYDFAKEEICPMEVTVHKRECSCDSTDMATLDKL